MEMMERAEHRRDAALACLDSTEQAARGQFFTPPAVADIMARMVRMSHLPESGVIRILDPGAGTGMLSVAVASYLRAARPNLTLEITAVENDPALLPALREALADCAHLGATVTLVPENYFEWAPRARQYFDLIIQNPPYHKLRVGSPDDVALRAHGIQVPNVYAAFMALGIRQLGPRGQMVVISPRSWMNGTYYSRFRKDLISRVSLDAIHTFESRSLIFGDMDVLQESIIMCVSAGIQGDRILIRSSMDAYAPVRERTVATTEVIRSNAIFVPASQSDSDAVSWMESFPYTLADLGLNVSTGKVVGFRCKEIVHPNPDLHSQRLIYPTNIVDHRVVHPRATLSKPQWINPVDSAGLKLLCPAGSYVLVKRFSSKEEARRIVSAVWTSAEPSAFDNKLNYIHESGGGLDPVLARGIALWLNSPQVDAYFRVFSGHTQVNATDLRLLKFPDRDALVSLARQNGNPALNVQHLCDGRIKAA